jgi:hypothetical protein
MRTVFLVPRLNQASVVAGACCPVPAEALIVPELEAIPGVAEAAADWRTAQVIVQHAPDVSVEELAQMLAELGYPAESSNRNIAEPGGVSSFD